VISYVLPLTLGLSVYLIYDGLVNPRPAETSPRLERVHDFLLRAGLPEVRPAGFLVFSLLSGVLLALFAQTLLGWPAVTALAGLAGLFGPLAYYLRRHSRRRAALQLALIEAMSQLRDSIRIGFAVQASMVALAETGPGVLRPEFAGLVRHMQSDRFDRALVALRERLADPMVDLFVAALLASEETGARNLSDVLDRLTQAMRGELQAQQEIRAYQARTVAAARIIAAAPVAALILIRELWPRYFDAFAGMGQLWLVAVFVLIALGYGGMLSMTRLPGESRVLR
jgi:tight adherence protein B